MLLVHGLGEVGVQAHLLVAGQVRRRPHQSGVTEKGEQGATTTRVIDPGEGSW